MSEDLKKLLDAADPNNSWRYIEAPEGHDGEWFGCGVERNGGDEFIWDDFNAETAIPTNRLIAMAPDLARRVIAAEAAEARHRAELATLCKEFGITPPRELTEALDAMLAEAEAQGYAKGVREAAEARPSQYSIYGADRTDAYARGFCFGVEAYRATILALLGDGA